jgi:UDP-glucuronate 4-epimerase
MKKRILVTGAAGFIGFHAIQALNAGGDLVIGIDNYNSYYAPELKRERSALLQKLGINIIEGDINHKSLLQTIVEKNGLTHVLHLAAQAGVRYAKTNPQAYLESNINGFLSLLETLRSYPQIKLVYASSSSVYGKNCKIPFSIEDTTDKPANLYAATKKANELMAYSYHHMYGIKAIGLRFFTVYGPWGRPDMAYYSFTEAILNGNPIQLFNQGNMQRDFTYIDDIVKGIIAAIDFEEEDYALFNLGNHQPIHLLDFVSILENLLGKKAQKIFSPPSEGEVDITFADITSAQKKLGFYPTTSLETGLLNFVSWHREFNAR